VAIALSSIWRISPVGDPGRENETGSIGETAIRGSFGKDIATIGGTTEDSGLLAVLARLVDEAADHSRDFFIAHRRFVVPRWARPEIEESLQLIPVPPAWSRP